jgi:hypothetical protein
MAENQPATGRRPSGHRGRKIRLREYETLFKVKADVATGASSASRRICARPWQGRRQGIIHKRGKK